jgi:hypothetical protein
MSVLLETAELIAEREECLDAQLRREVQQTRLLGAVALCFSLLLALVLADYAAMATGGEPLAGVVHVEL